MPSLVRPVRHRLESTILAEIRAWAGTQPDLTLWRNNVGMLEDRTGRPVRYGLCEGSADLVGMLRVPCHPLPASLQAISRPIARFLAIEVKMPGKHPTPAQVAWLDLVTKMGGIAGICRSVEDAEMLVSKGRRWEI